MARMVNCIKLGREAEGLDLPRIRASWASAFLKAFPRKPGSSGFVCRR